MLRLGSSKRRMAGQVVFLMAGVGVAVLGLLFPQQSNVIACLLIGGLVALLGLLGLMFVDELTVWPDGRWKRTRGLRPFVSTTVGDSREPLRAELERRETISHPTNDVYYTVVIRFPNGDDLRLWPDAALLRLLGLPSLRDKQAIVDALNRRLLAAHNSPSAPYASRTQI